MLWQYFVTLSSFRLLKAVFVGPRSILESLITHVLEFFDPPMDFKGRVVLSPTLLLAG